MHMCNTESRNQNGAFERTIPAGWVCLQGMVKGLQRGSRKRSGIEQGAEKPPG